MQGAATGKQFDSSAEALTAALAEHGYLPDATTALVAFLGLALQKPILVEGPAGVGKTELAKALGRASGREMIRLQCYEGLDESKALYEWNYRKQLLRIQAGNAAQNGGSESAAAKWDSLHDDIFTDEFLLARPLLAAIRSEQPVVLLIDEIDKTDHEFEALLLEILSDSQVSVPELGTVTAKSSPLVLLTSNNTRELSEALKRRCLYLWLDYPTPERELEIVRIHAPEFEETIAKQMIHLIGEIRALELKKPPSVSESVDWARTLLLLGAKHIDRKTLEETLPIIVKHRSDIGLVKQRVSLKLK